MLGVTQEKMADELGVTFQQVQKYEKGTNRISASRLQHLAGILQVPVAFFFEDAPSSSNVDVNSMAYVSEFIATADGQALIKAFMLIKRPMGCRAIVTLVKEIAGED